VIAAGDLLEIVGALESAGIWYRLDGGWGIDALAGAETRPHDDVDVVVPRADLERCAAALAGLAHDPEAWPGLPARLVLRDERGRRVDLHPVVFDEAGNGWQQVGDDAWGFYPVAELDAVGRVGGVEVRCVSALLQLQHHQGYEWRDLDRHDVGLLAERLGISLRSS
jgi:lincosamide nucleotidyltransferase A/C/D/E